MIIEDYYFIFVARESSIFRISPTSKMKSHGCIMKELHQLLRDIETLTERQCKVHKILDDDDGAAKAKRIVKFVISIKPNSGLYKDGKFYFLFKVSHRYPVVAPEVKCLTHIYHPNIDDAGEICLSLFEDWSSDYNCLMHCIHGLLFLLKNPNLEDPLSPYFCPEDAEDMDTFYENVRKSLQGGMVDGFRFEKNIVTDEEYSNATVNKAIETVEDDFENASKIIKAGIKIEEDSLQ